MGLPLELLEAIEADQATVGIDEAEQIAAGLKVDASQLLRMAALQAANPDSDVALSISWNPVPTLRIDASAGGSGCPIFSHLLTWALPDLSGLLIRRPRAFRQVLVESGGGFRRSLPD